MRNFLTYCICLLAIMAYGQQDNIPFDGHTWEPPYSLPTPTGWGIERFLVPPGFAPAITYQGVEDIRFAPGWAKQGSDEYWSYAFLWYLDNKPTLTTTQIEADLKAYYTGLYTVNSDSALLAKEPPLVVVTQFKSIKPAPGDGPSFTGTVRMRDYMTRQPITLHCIVRSRICAEAGKELVFFQLSPKSFKHSLWKSLGQLWLDFRCVK